MIFTKTLLDGAYVIDPHLTHDDRGFFARSFCRDEFISYGLNPAVAQCNISFNFRSGTLRGMHYQWPKGEDKLVRCTRGRIYDVIVDLRESSNTYCRYFSIELTEQNRRMLYIPAGFAHGFMTLEESTEIFYQMSEFYAADQSKGVRWNDPAFAIDWPMEAKVMSDRDKNYPDFKK